MSLLLRHIARQCQLHSRRFLSSNSKRFVTYPLLKRGLIKITGIDSSPFLQGLVTNDMNFLESECFALYSMILNPQGRALYDTIIYNYGRLANEKEPTFFLEFDLKAINDVQKVLTLYKIRRKVTITNISEEVKIFHLSTGNQSAIEPADLQFSDKKNVLMCHSDPRLMSFGCRLLVKTGHPGSHVLPNCVDGPDDADYTRLRYQLGIPEGIVEIPPGNRLPLEYNLVYLNGVSFDKGCYVGQELTARTHYTGVIRKRVMPIMLEKTSPHLQAGAEIFSSNQKKAGKYINSLDKYGLALLRLTEANSDLSIHLKNGEKLKVTAHTPTWWPKEDVSKATKT